MRLVLVPLLAIVISLPSIVRAGLNRNYLVPSYEPCPGSGNCNPPTRASAYTFDSIVLFSSPQRYSGPNKLALMIIVKGLRDPSGNPFTGTLRLTTGTTRITLLTQGVGTLGDTSPLAYQPPYNVDVKNGAGRARFTTPEQTPEHGLIAESVTAPVLFDPDGKPLASTGTQSKP